MSATYNCTKLQHIEYSTYHLLTNDACTLCTCKARYQQCTTQHAYCRHTKLLIRSI